MQIRDFPEIEKLSIPEKILLVEELWDSLASDESRIPVPASHKDELDKRWKSSTTIGTLLSLEELKANIESRK